MANFSIGAWGSVAAILDPSKTDALVISVASQRAQQVGLLVASLFSGSAPARLIVLDGLLPNSLSALAAWDGVDGLPQSSGTATGLARVLLEVIIPASAIYDLSSSQTGAPVSSGGGGGVTVILIPFAVAGAGKVYASLTASGQTVQAASDGSGVRALSPAAFGVL